MIPDVENTVEPEIDFDFDVDLITDSTTSRLYGNRQQSENFVTQLQYDRDLEDIKNQFGIN